MRLRRLTAAGIEQFSSYLDQLKADPKLPPPVWLLEEAGASEAIGRSVMVELREFATRLDAAKYLDGLLLSSGLDQIERDVGLWSWLTLFYFDQICPQSRGGKREAAVRAAYIPLVHIARRAYRHLFLGPWAMLRLHRDNPDRLLALLSNAPHIATSETYRLFIENPTLVTCNSVVDVATMLYFDFEKQRIKRGAGRKDNGGCRRLIAYLQQLDCTYDLSLISQEKLLALLPSEFRPFVPKQPALFP